MADFSAASLRGYRNGRGMSIRDVALKARISPTRLSALESTASPTPGELEALSAALSLPQEAFRTDGTNSLRDYARAVASVARPFTDDEAAQTALVLTSVRDHDRAA